MASEIYVTQAAVSPVRMQEGAVRNKPGLSIASLQGSKQIVPKQSEKTEKSELENRSELKGEEELTVLEARKKDDEESRISDKLTKLNGFVQNLNRDIEFSFHEESGRTVVTVLDSETEKVIRKIPSDEVLRIAESLENLSGLLLKEQA